MTKSIIVFNIIILLILIKASYSVYNSPDKDLKKYIRSLTRKTFFTSSFLIYIVYILLCSPGILLIVKNPYALIAYFIISLLLYIILSIYLYSSSVSTSDKKTDSFDIGVNVLVAIIIGYMII